MVNISPGALAPPHPIPVLSATSSQVLPAGASGWHLCTQIKQATLSLLNAQVLVFSWELLKQSEKVCITEAKETLSWQCQSSASADSWKESIQNSTPYSHLFYLVPYRFETRRPSLLELVIKEQIGPCVTWASGSEYESMYSMTSSGGSAWSYFPFRFLAVSQREEVGK